MTCLVNFLILLLLVGFSWANRCSSYDDPHMTTFDGSNYEFQYSGDHFVLYDDFKDTRVTASYQSCGPYSRATCNCAVYLKKGRKITFVDFCSTVNPTTPTSQLYGVSLEKGAIGLNAIKVMPPCDIISPHFEDNEAVWANITTFLDDFKCARLQGSNYYDIFVIRTIEKDFQDSVKIKFKLATRTMPTLEIKPSLSSYENTGGLCGMWDNSRVKELYVLDGDGVEHYLPNLNNVELAREFWRLSSRYNKDYFRSKRCPECYLMSERSFYCPCDEFDMFDDENYLLDSPPSRSTYCKVPMFRCIEKLNNIEEIIPTETTTQSPISTTTKAPITEIEAEELCREALLNHPALKPLIENGCFDPNATITICAIDVFLTGDEDLINLHIQTSIDEAIQNILNGISNCTIDFLITLCPNNCNGNGICEINTACLIPGKAIYDEDCLAPVKCNCKYPWGGIDCNTSLLELPNIILDRSCCSLRNDQCTRINGFGYPFSKRDKIYARIDLIEENESQTNKITDNVVAITLSENNIVMNINKIKELSLYKNIFNETTPNQFKPSQSTARAFFYISYNRNETYTMDKATASFTLYDSRCRECINKETQIIEDKCDIEGICYFEEETSPDDEYLVCIPDENQIDWTYRPTTTPTTTTPEEPTTTEPVIPCNISLSISYGLINKNNRYLWTMENVSTFFIDFDILGYPRNYDCVVTDVLKITAKTKSYTAKNNINYKDKTETIELNNAIRDDYIEFQILKENGVTPFKFFVVEVTVESKLNVTYEYVDKIVVYIEDVDYLSTATFTPTGTFDILNFNIAKQDLSVAFISNSGSFVNLTANPYELCPFKNGIVSNYDKLKIKLEYLGNDFLKLHTLEVNNKDKCNLKTMNIRLLDFSQKPKTDYIQSNRIFQRPIIDFDLQRDFDGVDLSKNLVEIVEINWLDTIDGKNPGKCELRAFVEK